MPALKFCSIPGKYLDDAALKAVVNYSVLGSELYGLVGGHSVNPANALVEMATLNRLTGQEKGRRLYHTILSFAPEELQDYELLFKITNEVTKFFAEYQVIFAVHIDQPHLHSHIIVNTTNYKTYKKMPNDWGYDSEFHQYCAEVLEKYHFNKLQKVYFKEE